MRHYDKKSTVAATDERVSPPVSRSKGTVPNSFLTEMYVQDEGTPVSSAGLGELMRQRVERVGRVSEGLSEQELLGHLSASPSADMPGQDSIRQSLSDQFGADFRGLKVTRDSTLSALGERAYTKGNEIHLAPDVDISSGRGQTILHHEAAHVLQQGTGVARGVGALSDGRLETQADQVASGSTQIDVSGFSMPSAGGAPVQGFMDFIFNRKKYKQRKQARQEEKNENKAQSLVEPENLEKHDKKINNAMKGHGLTPTKKEPEQMSQKDYMKLVKKANKGSSILANKDLHGMSDKKFMKNYHLVKGVTAVHDKIRNVDKERTFDEQFAKDPKKRKHMEELHDSREMMGYLQDYTDNRTKMIGNKKTGYEERMEQEETDREEIIRDRLKNPKWEKKREKLDYNKNLYKDMYSNKKELSDEGLAQRKALKKEIKNSESKIPYGEYTPNNKKDFRKEAEEEYHKQSGYSESVVDNYRARKKEAKKNKNGYHSPNYSGTSTRL